MPNGSCQEEERQLVDLSDLVASKAHATGVETGAPFPGTGDRVVLGGGGLVCAITIKKEHREKLVQPCISQEGKVVV